MTAEFNIAPRILHAAFVPPLSDLEVNGTLAELWHSNPDLAEALAADWARRRDATGLHDRPREEDTK